MEKVLHILPMNKVSGAERMALLICKNMKQFEPVVVCGGENLRQVFQESNIKSYSIKFSTKNIVGSAINIRKIVKHENIKIVHAHDNLASLIAYVTKKMFLLNIKIVSHIHNCYPFLKYDGLNKKIDKFVRNRYDYNVTCGTVVTDFYKENAEYFNANKVVTLPNAMDVEHITKVDKVEIEALIKEYNIPSNKKVLGFIGRLDEQKGIIPFINEFAKYKDAFKDCVVLLVGNGSQEYEIKKLLKNFNLENMFILTGFQNYVYKFYPIIDIFFLPSLYEGLPMVLLEAMAFKKAIISMNVGSISQVIKNQETGILIEPNNYDEFIERLIEIKDNNELREVLGKQAFELVNNNFNISEYEKIVRELYRNIS